MAALMPMAAFLWLAAVAFGSTASPAAGASPVRRGLTRARAVADAARIGGADEPRVAAGFSEPERSAVYRAIYERRDMRHFLPTPVDPVVLARLLEAAHHAPSVGFMQPWRIVRVTSPALRRALHAAVEAERLNTADALGERSDEFCRLKVQGILDCGEVLIVGLMDERDGHIFGRRTMAHMDLASAACAIQNFQLAARAEGLGVGWVSMFEPDAVRALIGMPAGASPVAILCVGHVEAFYPRPMLETEGWAERRPLELSLDENRWPTG